MNARVLPFNTPSILIIGSGFGGLGMAIRLKQAGIRAFTILEKGANVGGTWRDNTYPGAACDVQSHLYSFSFEPKGDWSRKFARQPEIQAYLEHCASKYDLHQHLRFGAEVAQAEFDEPRAEWRVTLTSGEVLAANVLISAAGQLNQPAMPNIPGQASFAGKAFHSARWEHDYDFGGKRVAVIGTGASAIQFVPQLVPKVKSLTLFQRSGAWVIPKPDRPFKPWEKLALKRLPLAGQAYRSLIYWQNESRALAFTRFDRLLDAFSLSARFQAFRHVKDAGKRRALIPDYRIGCKRILMANDWYQAINAPQVQLESDAIARIDKDAIVTRDGRRHEVDAIIYGTGFKAADFLTPMHITGRDGISLTDAWRQGAEAYKGISVAGFPNLFLLYGPNTNLSHNSIVFMLESQIHYVLACLERLKTKQAACMEVREAAQRADVDRMQARLANSVWASGCSSWYINKDGRNVSNWPGFTFVYRQLTRRVREADYQFTALPQAQQQPLRRKA